MQSVVAALVGTDFMLEFLVPRNPTFNARISDETGREQRTHLYQATAAAKVDFSFMRVTRRAKQVPLPTRPRFYREAALRADEMIRGPRERKRNTPSTAKKWRTVDD